MKTLNAFVFALPLLALTASKYGEMENTPTPSSTNPVKPETVFVEGGTYTKGCVEGHECQEWYTHTITVDDFRIAKKLVTVGEFKKFCAATGRNMPSTPPWGWVDEHPIAFNFWEERDDYGIDEAVEAYCAWVGGRLATDSEWEYAARGGKKSKGYILAGGDEPDEVAWHGGNSGETMQPVGKKKPNELGIFDMSGLVCELVRHDEEDVLINRYGDYAVSPYFARVINDYTEEPFMGEYAFGFRVVFNP